MSDHWTVAQIRKKAGQKIVFLLVLVVFIPILAACGKKPSHVDPPVGVIHDDFPRKYPDPSTDPKPEDDSSPDQQ